jgi:phosphatidate cytidylyltransferase
MFWKRLLVTITLLPVGLVLILLGGWALALFVALIALLASREYVQMMRVGGYRPAGVLVMLGCTAVVLARAWDGFASTPLLLSLLVLAAMTSHLVDYERGRDLAGTDFGVSLGGLFYIGFIGAYLISLRNLPEGQWWFLVALPSIWAADSGAYVVGSRFGKHKLSPRLSPKKTWEGYLGGIVAGTLAGALLPLLLGLFAGPDSAVTPVRGLVLGFILAVLTILGDLGESMFKRQVGMKDSGNLLPGHGGAFDRIDSWLWAGVISYYVIFWFFNI